MKTTEVRKDKQEWKVGNVVGDRELYYLIVKDYLSGKYRILSLRNYSISIEEYDSVEEIRMKCGDLNPVAHAEILVEE